MERRILLIIVIYLVHSSLYAQTCEWVSTRNYSSSNIASSAGTDAQGNVYLSGKFTAVGWRSGPSGCVISKFTHEGALQWTDTLRAIDTKIAVDPSGDVYATGGFYNSISLGNCTATANGYNSFIARYDAAGNCIWVRSLHLTGTEDIAVRPGEGFYIAGKAGKDSTIRFDNYVLKGKAFFIARYDDAGNCKWVKDVPFARYGLGKVSVTADRLGNVYAAAPGLPMRNGEQGFAIKYDGDGNQQWVTPVPAIPSDISVDDAGNTLLTGSFTRTTAFSSGAYSPATGCSSSFIIKLDSKGTEAWSKVFEGNYGPAFTSISAAANGSFYVAGSFYKTAVISNTTITTDDPEVNSGNQLVVARFNSNGEAEWVKQTKSVSGNYPPECTAQALSIDSRTGGLYVCGNAGDTTIFDDTRIEGASYSSMFIMRIKDEQASHPTESFPVVKADLSVFPNPGKGVINFTYDTSLTGNVSLKLFNTSGDLILSREYVEMKNNSVEGSLDLQQQSPGVYLLEMKNGTTTTVRRVVIQE